MSTPVRTGRVVTAATPSGIEEGDVNVRLSLEVQPVQPTNDTASQTHRPLDLSKFAYAGPVPRKPGFIRPAALSTTPQAPARSVVDVTSPTDGSSLSASDAARRLAAAKRSGGEQARGTQTDTSDTSPIVQRVNRRLVRASDLRLIAPVKAECPGPTQLVVPNGRRLLASNASLGVWINPRAKQELGAAAPKRRRGRTSDSGDELRARRPTRHATATDTQDRRRPKRAAAAKARVSLREDTDSELGDNGSRHGSGDSDFEDDGGGRRKTKTEDDVLSDGVAGSLDDFETSSGESYASNSSNDTGSDAAGNTRHRIQTRSRPMAGGDGDADGPGAASAGAVTTAGGKEEEEAFDLTARAVDAGFTDSVVVFSLLQVNRKDQRRFLDLWARAQKIKSILLVAISSDASGSGTASSGSLITPERLKSALGIGVAAAAGDVQAKSNALLLTPYQLIGINWLYLLHRHGYNGLLADEMGLGKSVQTAVLLSYLGKVDRAEGPHLVVTPASTLSNWKRELSKWAPGLRVGTYRGGATRWEQQGRLLRPLSRAGAGRSSTPSSCQLADEDDDNDDPSGGSSGASNGEESESPEPFTKSQTRSFDVLLVAYGMFDKTSSSAQMDRSFLKKFSYGYLVLDEGHAVKNASSQRYRHLYTLRADHRLLLSGTPVQNNVSQLFSLLRFIMPDLFDRRAEKLFAGALEREEVTASDAKGGLVCELRNILEPFVLRRSKADVLASLPAKTETVVHLEMLSGQVTVYHELLLRAKRLLLEGKSASAGGQIINADASTRRAAAAKANGVLTSRSRRRPAGEDTKSADKSGDGADIIQLVTSDESSGNEAPASEARTRGPPSASVVRSMFTDLRKAANHPLLLRTLYTHEKTLRSIASALCDAGAYGEDPSCTPDRVYRELCTASDFDIHQQCVAYGSRPRFTGTQESVSPSGFNCVKAPPGLVGSALLGACVLPPSVICTSNKFVYLREALPALGAAGHRVLLFSQWTKILDLLQSALDIWGIEWIRLDGSTPVQDRQIIIDRFSREARIGVFLLSTRAGGLGLNLTAADTVILHDVDFNPFVDQQAVDRAHRLGQERPVTVTRLVTKGSVDERIAELAARKTALDSALKGQVVDGTGNLDNGELAAPASSDALIGTLADLLDQEVSKATMMIL